MHDHLKDIPVTERPKMVPLFPSGASCFRAWRSLRWFLALLLPITGSAVAYWLRKHEIGFILFICIVGALVAACLFVALCSGMASSNWAHIFGKLSQPDIGYRSWLWGSPTSEFHVQDILHDRFCRGIVGMHA